MARRSLFVTLLALLPLPGCAASRPSTLGVTDRGLAPCPSSPNCISSQADDASPVAPVEPLPSRGVSRGAGSDERQPFGVGGLQRSPRAGSASYRTS